MIALVIAPVGFALKNMKDMNIAMANLRSVGSALALYASDHNDQYPPAKRWQDAIASTVPASAFHATAASTAQTDFAFHSKYGGAVRSKIQDPANKILLFDSTLKTRNANGGFELIPARGQFRNRALMSFVDGHTRVMRGPRLKGVLDKDR